METVQNGYDVPWYIRRHVKLIIKNWTSSSKFNDVMIDRILTLSQFVCTSQISFIQRWRSNQTKYAVVQGSDSSFSLITADFAICFRILSERKNTQTCDETTQENGQAASRRPEKSPLKYKFMIICQRFTEPSFFTGSFWSELYDNKGAKNATRKTGWCETSLI